MHEGFIESDWEAIKWQYYRTLRMAYIMEFRGNGVKAMFYRCRAEDLFRIWESIM